MASSNLKAFSDHDFDRDVVGAAQPTLVEFGATWCGPCRAIAPVLDRLAATYEGRVQIGALDVDTAPRIAARYDVRSVPTMLLFHRGRVVAQLVGAGARTREHLVAAFEKALA